MPLPVVLLVIGFFAVGSWYAVRPIEPARVKQFAADPAPDDVSVLLAYLRRRRRWRTGGVLIAAAVGLIVSIPRDRVEVGFVALMAGWLAGAIMAEISLRTTPGNPVGVRQWELVAGAVAVTAVLWTVSAVLLRSEGVSAVSPLRWGAAALATTAVLLATARYISRNRLRDVDETVSAATTVDAVRGLTLGGVLLALLCLAKVWMAAVPGPYDEAAESFGPLWLAGCALAVAVLSLGNLRRVWPAYLAVVLLPFAWAVPVRLAQQPPFSAEAAHATAEIRLARLDALAAARAELGLGDKIDAGYTGAEMAAMSEIIGRVDVGRPAPQGTLYQVVAIDRRTGTGVAYLFGDNGAGWYGGWSMQLPARYPWLSGLAPVQSDLGYTMDTAMAISGDRESGLPWFRSTPAEAGEYSAEDLLIVLMLVRNRDSYVYWATSVPTSTS